MTPNAASAVTSLDVLLVERWSSDPEAVVVVTDAGEVRAAEVHRRAAAVAARLRRPGADQVRVAVYLNKSVELVTALAGAVLASAIQLALDPDDPAARTAFMVADFGPDVLVTSRALAARLPELPSAVTVVLVEELDDERAQPAPWSPAAPDSALYAVYTSGSSGRPKASFITHRSLANCLSWLQETFGLDSGDRVLYRTACGFDVSVAELYWPLVSGAALVVPDADRARDVEYLADLVIRHEVTTLHFVPSLLEVFLLALPPHVRFDTVRRVLAGGEALSPGLVRSFQARSSAELWNMYGPSECTIYTTAWHCPPGLEPDAVVPIGPPVRGVRCLVLDDRGRPVPDGEVGELHIGGAGLALGYWRRPSLTAARFRPDPQGTGERIYASGDLVRLRPDGAFEYLGRVDQQVKIRGYRIELGEIEATLAGCDGVRQAAVVSTRRGDATLLVAFVVVGPELADPTGEDLSDRLRARLAVTLPAYMVPYRVVAVDRFAVTPNGKLDRAGLSALAAEVVGGPPNGGSSKDPVPTTAPATAADPLTATEALVAEACREVLGVAEVPGTGNFFDLGGDSLAVIRLLSRLHAACGARLLDPADVYQEPTPAALAVLLDRRRAAEVGRSSTLDGPDQGEVPRAAYEMWLHEQMHPGDQGAMIAAAFAVTGGLDAARLAEAVVRVARRHPALGSMLEFDGATVRRVPCAEEALVASLRPVPLPGGVRLDRGLVVVEDGALEPFDLEAAPPWRVYAGPTPTGEELLMLVLHHVAVDGRSEGIVLDDLSAAYRGEPLPAPDAGRTAPAGAAARHTDGDDAPGLDAAEPPAVARVPAGEATARTGVHRLALDAATVDRLVAERVPTSPTPLQTLLLGALGRALGAEADLLVGVAYSGRDDDNADEVGLFVDLLPVVLPAPSAGGDPHPRIDRSWLAAVRHRGRLSLAELSQLLRRSDRSGGRTPFPVVFALQSGPPTGLALGPDLTTRRSPVELATPPFDVYVEAWPADGGLELLVHHDGRRVDPAWADRLAEGLRSALAAGPAGAADPAAGTESVVAEVWCEVLGVARVPRSGNFFDLGGDSLAAVRVTRSLRSRTGASVQARMLFDAPVLADFAAVVAAL